MTVVQDIDDYRAISGIDIDDHLTSFPVRDRVVDGLFDDPTYVAGKWASYVTEGFIEVQPDLAQPAP